VLERLAIPIVGAPLGGGPSTPELTAAVSDAGGLGFLAAAYKTPEAMSDDVAAVRRLTRAPFGVNVFAVTPTEADPAALEAFAARLRAAEPPLEPGTPRSDDDHFAAKVERLLADPVPVVSFTFGCPAAGLVERFQAAGTSVWVTVTDVPEARAAAAAGADALVVQGVEAGGHRGSFDDEAPGDSGLLALLQLVGAAVELPLVATGGIATGRAVAAVLLAGASAAQVGTALMLAPEAGTSPAHRDALPRPGRTALTRAFTGRTGRGIVNRFMREHDRAAPPAYPAVHHITAPVRAAARERGDAELLNLWAGQAHELARPVPAGQLVRELHRDALEAVAELQRRLDALPQQIHRSP
jgi:nitronate monooxygenase